MHGQQNVKISQICFNIRGFEIKFTAYNICICWTQDFVRVFSIQGVNDTQKSTTLNFICIKSHLQQYIYIYSIVHIFKLYTNLFQSYVQLNVTR